MTREEDPGKAPEWVKLNGNDHFFHASAYALVAEKVYYVEGLGEIDLGYANEFLDFCGPQDENTDQKNLIDNVNLVGYSKSENLSLISGLNYRG